MATAKESQYDVIVVLGAAMQKNTKRNRWDFPSIIQEQPGKIVAGKARALAVRELARSAPIFLVTGGVYIDFETGGLVSRSQELVNLITDRYRVHREQVIPIGRMGEKNTLGNVETVVQYLRTHLWLVKKKKIGILSIGSHLDRAQLMFERNSFIQEHGIAVEMIAAEDILANRSKRYRTWATALYATPEGQENMQMERQGVEDVKNGVYRSKSS